MFALLADHSTLHVARPGTSLWSGPQPQLQLHRPWAPGAHKRRRVTPAEPGVAPAGPVRRRPCASAPASLGPPLDGVEDMLRPGVQRASYDWKDGLFRVNYIHAGESGPPVLMVHGFGVGAFHYQKNVQELSQTHRVWAVDLVGQGSSWPQRELREDERVYYSVDTWTEQLKHFIDVFIGGRAYIIGNSLGGYLAVNLASHHPEAVSGLLLLNATPFWALRPALGQTQGIWKLLSFDGSAPVPQSTKTLVERAAFSSLRNPETIRSMLKMVYTNPIAADDELISEILAATEHPHALDAFASILFSPGARRKFDQMLLHITCPVALAYGRNDPWVVPLWGQRIKRQLPSAPYYELAPCGHCPHHEAPEAINWLAASWISSVEAQQPPPLDVGESRTVDVGGRPVSVTHVDGSPRNVFERLDFARWWLVRWYTQRLAAGAASAAPGSAATPAAAAPVGAFKKGK